MTVASYSLRKKGEAVKENIVRGYHMYKEVWRPVIGQELPVFPEQRRAVAIYRDGVIVSHVPREMVCLKHDGKIICEITGIKCPLKIVFYLELIIQCLDDLSVVKKTACA